MAFLNDDDKIWGDGEFFDVKDAKISFFSHVIHYGSAVFEGLRCYDTSDGPAVFRLDEHMQRLLDSAKIYRIEIPFSKEVLNQAVIDTIKINNLGSCYIRPIAFRGFKQLGVSPLNIPVHTAIAVWEWGSYLGAEKMLNGVKAGVSSWRKPAPDTLPVMAKSAANYMNSQLASMEASEHGYDEAILLDYQGYVAEGSGENIFLVEGDTIYTPDLSSILKGITRDTVITLARDLGYKVVEETIARERLYLADEVFFTGSAAEVTPISSIDNRKVGTGIMGEVTKEIQGKFFEVVKGQCEDKYGWLTHIE